MKRILILLLLLSSCHKKECVQNQTSYPINVTKVKIEDAPIFIETIGHVEPIISVNITSRVRGQITDAYFKEGDYVKKGDLLFTIDPLTLQATLDKANAVLLENLASLKLAEEKVQRYTSLTKEEFYSKLNYDQLKSEVERLKAVVLGNKADIASAQINLDYSWIYSPLDGRTGILQITPGNMAKDDESQTFVTVNQMKPIYVTFSIPEKDLYRVRKYHALENLKVLVTFDDFKKESYQGVLQMFDNAVDPKTGMITLRATFANNYEELWPDQFVRTRLILTIAKNSIVIPYNAINLTTKGPFVFVVKENNTVEMRSVKLGQRLDDNIIILNGLQVGETIAIEGLINLSPGAHISIKNTNEY